MSLIVKIGKKGKRLVKQLLPEEKRYLSYTRRIERVKTDRRICAMTFDDGPMDLPAAPDRFGGRSLTDVLLDTLAEFGAKGTFDVIGDTSENYPDTAGKVGGAAWGGIKFDHYPDIGKDDRGGAVHCGRLIRRILDEGHQITNHGYRHIIFGKKPFVYGAREHLGRVDKAVDDLNRLDRLLREEHGYEMAMTRPPHYVDVMGDGFTSYDVCDRLGYQYLAASFDGAGWLPSVLPDPDRALEAEVDAMVEPMRRALEQDPDFLCGQIEFQKDGYNLAKRTPVAFGLRRQLELLRDHGYQVVTVAELMEESPFADLDRGDPLFGKLCRLQRDRAVAYSDNTVRLDQPMTWGELAMLLSPKKEAMGRRWAQIRRTGRRAHPYFGAVSWCVDQGLLPRGTKPDGPVTALPGGRFSPAEGFARRDVYTACQEQGDGPGA